jgi:hypothetical protein
MVEAKDLERVSTDEVNEGDEVVVHVNNRARDHLGRRAFRATVAAKGFGEMTLVPDEQLQDGVTSHTWYTDIGYIHGIHGGLGRYSDIGKVKFIEA